MLNVFKTGEDRALDLILSIAYAYRGSEFDLKKLPMSEFNQKTHENDKVFFISRKGRNYIFTLREEGKRVSIRIYH